MISVTSMVIDIHLIDRLKQFNDRQIGQVPQ
jgi:hypothetical protein